MNWFEELDKMVQEQSLELLKEAPLAQYTSFRIGGPARRLAFPRTEEEMIALLQWADAHEVPYRVLGNGSNLLVQDSGVDTLVIGTQKLCQLEKIGATTIRASAGITMTQLALFAANHGLTGLEFAHGIPGTLGGGLFMNAGAYEQELRQVVTSVSAWTKEGVRTFTNAEAQFAYRHSIFQTMPSLILSATLTLQVGEETVIRDRMKELMARRKKSQPLEWPSAGSTFKRPAGYFAGTLIEQTGLKGFSIGGAAVSEKHAGFLINRGGASCADVLQLIAEVQERVEQAHGVRLEPEVEIW